MGFRIDVALFDHITDTVGLNTALSIDRALGICVEKIRMHTIFTLDFPKDIAEELAKEQVQKLIDLAVLHDPVLQKASLLPLPTQADWILEVGFRPGVTDNEGRTAAETASLVLDLPQKSCTVFTAKQFHITGNLSFEEVERVAKELLANELIQRFSIKSKEEWQKEPGFPALPAKVTGEASSKVTTFSLSEMDDKALMDVSRSNTLALNLEEMQTIKNWFSSEKVANERKELGLPPNPTDAELEVLAQTWSEHCKHKIFASHITYTDKESQKSETINSLYKTYIQDVTKTLRERMGEKDFCRSVFKDNAGVVAFDENVDVCVKVETHNSPSALDPYGGALTGIVGVNRDPMGTGLGAKLVCNMDVFCFASPFYEGTLPPRLLHPRRVYDGVRLGVEHGGNKSGVPTVNGSVVFDERFLGKPLVFCGTLGLIPRMIGDRKGYEKKACVGDHIVMVGGKIGKDGIHGATFSSEELHEDSPATAVQIGDPITQRKMYDFIMLARDKGLYSAITDNGAGGLSSSVGEMCEDTGGCLMDLSKAPLKYDGLQPWEILLSEAQERMTLAVPEEHLETLLALAKDMDVEATALGTFTDSGYFHIKYKDVQVAYIHLDFLHDACPQLRLQATWEAPEFEDSQLELLPRTDHKELLLTMLGRLNICSKESMIRQYDHEVQGGSVVKPLCGVMADGPTDAAVLRPVLASDKGLVLAHGICPKFSDYDTYHMAANAIDEAIRNAVAVGADPDQLAGVDNFCWCDPVTSPSNPDGEYKLAQLVRTCKALADYCLDYGIPCVSGKDSMKNDYLGEGKRIAIPPTLLFTVVGQMPDVHKAVTSDFKNVGDLIYVLGETKRELAGSEFADALGITCNTLPKVDAKEALERYRTLHKAINQGLISACHDLSDGGLAVAFAEMALGGRMGAELFLDKVPTAEEGLTALEILYSETASRLLVSVEAKHQAAFEALFPGIAPIGSLVEGKECTVYNNDERLMQVSVEDMARAHSAPLSW